MSGVNDFNDLAAAEGLASVIHDVDAALPIDDSSATHGVIPVDRWSSFEDESFDAPPLQNAPEPPAWPEPMIPGTLRTPEFPEDILSGAWRDMAVAVSASTQTPPALSIMCVLGTLATLLQRRFEVAPHGDSYIEPLALWVVSASPSGTRKTAVMNAFLAPIVKWEKLQYDRYRVLIARNNAARSTAKKRIESLNQQAAKCKEKADLITIRDQIEREELDTPDEIHPPRLFTGDTTAARLQAMLFENSERMAVHSDEPGIFRVMAGAYTGGVADLDVYLQGHAGSPLRIDRATRTARIDKPALSFCLMIQPSLMSEVAGSSGFRASGLLARFLYAIPASNVGKRDVRKHSGIDDKTRERYQIAVNALLADWLCEPGTAPNIQTLHLSPAALELWLDFSQYIEDNHGDGGVFEGIRDWTSKLAGAVARIAALLELVDTGLHVRSVGFKAMDAAVRLAKVLIPHAQAAFGLLGADATDNDAMTVLRWARGKGLDGFKLRDAQKAMQSRFTNVERLKKAMVRLAEMDCVRPSMHKPPGGGRPSAGYLLNPALL